MQRVEFEETETELQAEEGYYVTIRCLVRGFPKPTITWSKEGRLVSTLLHTPSPYSKYSRLCAVYSINASDSFTK